MDELTTWREDGLPAPVTIDRLIEYLSALPAELRRKPIAYDGDGIMLAVTGVEEHAEFVQFGGGHEINRVLHPEEYDY